MAHLTIGVDLLLAAFTAMYLAKLVFVDVLATPEQLARSGRNQLGNALQRQIGAGYRHAEHSYRRAELGALGAELIREKRSLLNQHVMRRSCELY